MLKLQVNVNEYFREPYSGILWPERGNNYLRYGLKENNFLKRFRIESELNQEITSINTGEKY